MQISQADTEDFTTLPDLVEGGLESGTMAIEFGQNMLDTIRTQPALEELQLNVISLSAGGQWGAFGAGFITGWSQNPEQRRPSFDLVTGVSAGGLLAVSAFAGEEYDLSLIPFRGLEERDVATPLGFLTIPFRSSLRDPTPLENLVSDQIDREVVEQVARRHEGGSRLLVAATNLDTTLLEVFDMGLIASDETISIEDRVDCMTEVLLASAAVPGLFPPRNINGALYADGGLRDHIFFEEVERARLFAQARTNRRITVDAYTIVNGPLTLPNEPVEDRLLAYFGRSIVALNDEVLRDSVIETIEFATMRDGWTLRGIIPQVDATRCGFEKPPSFTFDECFTRLLYDTGLEQGRQVPIPWLSSDELLERALRIVP